MGFITFNPCHSNLIMMFKMKKSKIEIIKAFQSAEFHCYIIILCTYLRPQHLQPTDLNDVWNVFLDHRLVLAIAVCVCAPSDIHIIGTGWNYLSLLNT